MAKSTRPVAYSSLAALRTQPTDVIRYNFAIVAENLTLNEAHAFVLGDTSTKALVFTLPLANSTGARAGKSFQIKRLGNNPLTVLTSGSDTIDTSTQRLLNNLEVMTVVSDGVSSWMIAAENSLICPVIINEDGEPCDPVLRVEGDTTPNLFYIRGSNNRVAINSDNPTNTFTIHRTTGELVYSFDALSVTPTGTFQCIASIRPGNQGSFVQIGSHGSDRYGSVWMTKLNARAMHVVASNPTMITADQTAWPNPAFAILRLTSNANYIIRGIVAPPIATEETNVLAQLIMVSNFTLTFTNQDAAATAANRIITNSAATPVVIGPNDIIQIWYDDDSSRWRILK